MKPGNSENQSEQATVPQPLEEAKPGWIGGAVVLGLVAFAILFAFTDISELIRVLANAEWHLLILPLLCVVGSYFTMALSYHGIAKAAGGQIDFFDMLKITLVANSLNYILATGGLSGFAARMYYFTRRSIPASTAIVISLAQTFLTNLTLLAFVLIGFAYVFSSQELDGAALTSTAVMLFLFLSIAALATALLLHPTLRRKTLAIGGQLVLRATRRFVPNSELSRVGVRRYEATLDRGIAFLLRDKRSMIMPLVFITIDWVLTIMILHTSFLALRYTLPFGETVVGFSVGIVLSFVSLVPGGLGVMEGSMSAIFSGMGVPFETAVASVLLFRIVYYIAPLIVSVIFFREMIAQVRSAKDRS